jgi:hypothetical protein
VIADRRWRPWKPLPEAGHGDLVEHWHAAQISWTLFRSVWRSRQNPQIYERNRAALVSVVTTRLAASKEGGCEEPLAVVAQTMASSW